MKKVYLLLFCIFISKLYAVETVNSDRYISSQQIEKNNLTNVSQEEINVLKNQFLIYESKIDLLQEQNNSLRRDIEQLDNCYKTNISFFHWAFGIVLTVILAFITFYALNTHKDNKKQISDIKQEYTNLYTNTIQNLKEENKNIINTKIENVDEVINKKFDNFKKLYESKLSNFEYQNLIFKYSMEENEYIKMDLAIQILDFIVNKKCDKNFGTDDFVQYLEYIKKEINKDYKFDIMDFDDIKEIISKIPDDLSDYKTFILDHNNFNKQYIQND